MPPAARAPLSTLTLRELNRALLARQMLIERQKVNVVDAIETVSADEAMAKALQEYVKQSIAPYKYPRAIEFIASLPRTENGKVKLFRLKQLHEESRRGKNA